MGYQENVTVLPSAARTATTSKEFNTKDGHKGALIFLNVTAVPGTDTTRLRVRAKDPVSGAYVTIASSAASAAAGMVSLYVHPATVNGSFDSVTVARPIGLPPTFLVEVEHVGVGSFTYSVGMCLMP